MSALLLRFAPYIIAVLAVFGAGIWTGHELDKPALARVRSEYAAFQIQVAHQQAASQKAATDALEAQIAARNITEANNAQIIRQLQSRADTAESDRDRANRLLELAAQARPVAGGDQLSETAGQPGTAPAGQASGANGLAELLVRTKQECADNADKLDALIAEIKPQL
jgi:hypothetical protein